jgi:hypothetical protein
MRLFQMSMTKDSAWSIVTELGQSNCVHFIDLNKNEQPFNLIYAKQLRSCEEALKNIK